MVLQVHHAGLLLLPECPELVLPLLSFVQGPLPSLVELGSTGAAILDVECLNLEVGLVYDGLVVDVVLAGRGAIILVPVECRNMEDGAYSQGVLHIVSPGMLKDNPVQPLDGVQYVLRDQLGSLYHGVLVAVELGSVPHIVQASHEDSVNRQWISHVGSLPSLLQGHNLGPWNGLHITV